MISPTASATMPGCASASAAVASTQPAVVSISSRFFCACASAQAPIAGMSSITTALETPSASVQASVAQSALPAIPATK